MSFAWVLNFDAEDELASATATTTSRPMRARFEAIAARAGIVGAGDVVIDDAWIRNATNGERHEFLGRAWCPTASALARMRAAGVTVPNAPRMEVLRRVNHRLFCAELGQTLPGAVFVASADECERVVRSGAWLLKRAFGFAGRGRRKVATLTVDDARWIEASMRAGGLQVEPLVAIDRDYAIHGVIAEDGALTLGVPTAQRCDEHGAWIASERATDLAEAERGALEREARTVARALADAAYFGPFNVDAYRWRDGDARRFNPRSEINARYSMGFMTGFGDRSH